MNDTTKPEEAPETTWQDRLQAEYEDLCGKLEKLGAFLDKVESGEVKVDPVTRTLLIGQHGAMTAYQSILAVRIGTRVQETPV